MNIASEIFPNQDYLKLEEKAKGEEEEFIKTMEKNPLLVPFEKIIKKIIPQAGVYKYENIKTLTDLNLYVDSLELSQQEKETIFNFNRDFLKDPLNTKIAHKFYDDLYKLSNYDPTFDDFFFEYIDTINKEYMKNVLLTPEEYNHFKAFDSGEHFKIHNLSHIDMILNRPEITAHRMKMLKFSKYFKFNFSKFYAYTEGTNFYKNLLKLNIHNSYYNLKMLGYVFGFIVGITFIFSGGIVSGYIINIKKSNA